MTPDQIQRIRASFTSKAKIFASELGNAIRRISIDTDGAPYDLKVHGGIRQFVREHFPNELKEDPSSFGVNLSFSVLKGSEATNSPPQTGTSIVLSGEGKRLWTVLTNPRQAGKAGWIATNKSVVWAPGESSSLPRDAIAIPRVSFDDYAELVGQYAKSRSPALDSQVANHLKAAVEPRDSSMGVRVYLALSKAKLTRDWEIFRQEEVVKLITDRASREIGAEAATQIGSMLLESKGSPQQKSARTRLRERTEGRNLRELILQVLPNLSENELRSIWLPVGLVADALTPNQKNH